MTLPEPWLELLGRLHPLVLHLPIGLLVGVIALELFTRLSRTRMTWGVRTMLVGLTAASGGAAALSGWLLGSGPDYGGELLFWHRWIGVALAAALGVAFIAAASAASVVYRGALASAVLLVFVAGHLGASITHGEDFVTDPLRVVLGLESDDTIEDDSVRVASSVPAIPDDVQSILNAHCLACHSDARRKGGLAMTSLAALREGGRSGTAISDAGAASSLLYQRITLPMAHDDHMPPVGKPQLSETQVALIAAWLNGAAAATTNVAQTIEESSPPLGAPPVEALAALQEALVHVEALGPDPARLYVDLGASAEGFDDADAERLLTPLRLYIVDLNAARSGMTDASAALIASMPNLEALDVTGVAWTDAGFAAFADHPSLTTLTICRTSIGDASAGVLAGLPRLSAAYVWGSALTDEGVASLRADRPGLVIETGEGLATEALESEGELVFGKPADGATVVASNDVCPVSGAPVDPKFTIVHDGKAIAFCCEVCVAKFWADPSAYVAPDAPDAAGG